MLSNSKALHRLLRLVVPTNQHANLISLTDSFGRQHDYLRISLTERCNLRCKCDLVAFSSIYLCEYLAIKTTTTNNFNYFRIFIK